MATVDFASPAGLDPALAASEPIWISGDILFETLVEMSPDFEIIPALADSWDISEDGLTYTFTLHQGVKFHNGREMTSEDVKYSLERLKDPATGSPRQNNLASVASIETPDPYTIIISLQEPFAALMSTLSHVTAAIIPKEEVDKGNFGQNPVGTGAFKFVEWIPDERVVMEAHQDYWRPGLPYLDRIVVTFSGDDNARVAALRSGDIDLLHKVPTQFVDTLRQDPALTVYGGEQAGMEWQHLLLNVQSEPFNDVLLRQALFAALDRAAIAEAGKPGHAEPLDAGFLPSWHWAALNETVWEQDPERVRELLTEAGHPEGFEFTMLVVAGFEFQTRTAQAIQQQLRPLGINAEIEVADFGVVLSAATSGEFDAIVLVFSPTFDPDERIQQTFQTGGGVNWGGFSDAEVDALAAEARTTLDQAARAELYRDLQRRLGEIGGWASLYTYNNYDATQAYVRDYTYYPQFYYRSLRHIWLDK
jgi:peptide/nickel transport system substrate-binding protein